MSTAAASARLAASEQLFGAEAGAIARLCHAMSERFARGGRLLAVGGSAADWSDARHVAVEFVHPVIVGKRALPALALDEAAVPLLAGPDDMVMRFAPLRVDDACFAAPTDDPFVAQELSETLYHVLWELVHVFFEHRGRTGAGTGASSFLYPFLGDRADDLDAVLADVRASVLAKAAEAEALREQTLVEGQEALRGSAAALRACFAGGGKVLALGNGGSATDAMDAVADLRTPPAARGWPARPALDLAGDAAILTAIANDIGTEALFARQVIAYGAPGDVLLAFSTSGNSPNVIAALAEARRRGLATVALVGYDGGRVLAERLADHVVVTRSEHIPRIQEAQASAWHVLRDLAEAA